jgi:hypothetical protein
MKISHKFFIYFNYTPGIITVIKIFVKPCLFFASQIYLFTPCISLSNLSIARVKLRARRFVSDAEKKTRK